MSQTSIPRAALDQESARRRWLLRTAAGALLGLAGALLGSSCGGEELRCWSKERCEPCPGYCLENAQWEGILNSRRYVVWVGKQGEEPTCEEFGQAWEADRWLDLQDDPTCPPCRCERVDGDDGGVGYSMIEECEPPFDDSVKTMRRPWDVCEPTGRTKAATGVAVPWYDERRACYSREDLFQPEATWKRMARICSPIEPAEYSCGDHPAYPTCLLDTRVLSDDFRICVGNPAPGPGDEVIAKTVCPPEFPERLDIYRAVSGCGACDCEPDGELCSMEFLFYKDEACSDLVLTQTLTTETACTELAEPVVIGSVKARMLREREGGCVDRGRAGIVEGEKIAPADGSALCCKPAGG
ncbi:hypothetical protein [Sorangium sp. So ce1182]|uniref:hypothetical protein n=1 Tax=Sorangium sp. So ce1182 TaxID=3133334 RepID=UPI003F5EA5E5